MKKPYTRPTLVTHGTVDALTSAIGGAGADGIVGSLPITNP